MHALYDPPLGRWIDGFLDRWLATDTRFPVATAATSPRRAASSRRPSESVLPAE